MHENDTTLGIFIAGLAIEYSCYSGVPILLRYSIC